MFSTNLRLNILLGICVSMCIASVLCIDGIDIQEEDIHVFKKPMADESITAILRTKRAAPKAKATTPKAIKPLVKSACEKGKLQVTCPVGQVIHFLQASYGRTNLAKCNPNKNKKFNVKCKSNKSDKIMRDKCHQKRSCTVEASNSVFGDPCSKTIKYLEMKYKCVTAKKVTPKIVITKKTTPKKVTPKIIPTTKIPPTKATTKQVSQKTTTIANTTPGNAKLTSATANKQTTNQELTDHEATVQATTHKETTVQETTKQHTTDQETTEQQTTEQQTTEQQTTAQQTTEQQTTEQQTTQQQTTQQQTTQQQTTQQQTTQQQTTVKQTPVPTTTKPRVTAPTTVCDLDDLDCIIKDLGDKPGWFVCESDMGSYPHPTTKKLFIFCLNWKPKVKKCGQNLVFSEDLMTCVSP